MKWNSYVTHIAIILILTLCGCSVSSNPPVPSSNFTAYYYDNTSLVGTETVERPAINYAYSDFLGIDSYNFHAIWKGYITVQDTAKSIDINFDVSWSDVSLKIDGKLISSWSNSNKSIAHIFTPGVHSIEIEYFNNWPTTDFNTSFTTNTPYTKDETITPITSLIDTDTKIVYVGAYESGNLYNDTTINLDNTSNKVFLFLSSYDSFRWIIHNPYGVQVSGIAYSSYSGVSDIEADSTIPMFEISDMSYGYNNFSSPSSDILYITGRTPDYTYGEYALTDTTVTGL
jgi:hypothetical protein